MSINKTPIKSTAKPKKHKGGNRTKLTSKKRKQFLKVLSETCNVTEAAREIGLARCYMYEVRGRKHETKFAEAWSNAIDQGIDALEREARRRATEGVEEGVYYKGDRIDTVRKYSDVLMIFLLKAHRPKTYRDRTDVNISGKLTLDGSIMSEAAKIHQDEKAKK